MNPVNRLLSRNISAGQITGYVMANLVGLTIVLTALQFYRDITADSGTPDSFITRDYLIISPRVSGLGSLGGQVAGFSEAEISEIDACPWVRREGRITSAPIQDYASVEAFGRPMGTSLFLESIPDSFFDITPPGWDWTPESGEPLPVVISKDYLTLYNFGFAASAGLPQVSESMLSAIPFRLSVSGNGRQEWLPARIAGFSSRLNTIAVPEAFMQWANARFADEPAAPSRRLIIEVSQPGSPLIEPFLADHGYEAAGDKADTSRMIRLLSVITGVVIAVGTIISILAFFILLLSIWLLLQKNRSKLHMLMQLGYTPAQVSRPYTVMVCIVNAAVLALALAITLISQLVWSTRLDDLGLSSASPWITIVTGIAIAITLTLLNIIAIRRRVASAFRI